LFLAIGTVPYLQHFEHGIRYRTSSHSLYIFTVLLVAVRHGMIRVSVRVRATFHAGVLHLHRAVTSVLGHLLGSELTCLATTLLYIPLLE